MKRNTLYKIGCTTNVLVLQYGTYKLDAGKHCSINPYEVDWRIRNN